MQMQTHNNIAILTRSTTSAEPIATKTCVVDENLVKTCMLRRKTDNIGLTACSVEC